MRATSVRISSAKRANSPDPDLLRPVAERVLGLRVHLDHDAVGARGHRCARERQHEIAAPGGVRRVDEHRQMGLALEHRHRREVERVPRRALERLDPALAEDHALVPLLRDVLGRHEELLDGRGRRALEEHRVRHAADLGEEVEVVHVARADLDHVRDLGDRRDVARIEELGDDRQARLLARLGEDLEALRAEALERVRRGARLERAAAEHRRAGRGDRARRLERLLARLDRARPRDEPEEAVADPPSRAPR